MAPISFVIVKPGKRATAAAKHEQRVGIHSHAQKVTQQRKRDQRQKEVEKVKTLISAGTKDKAVNNEIVKRFTESHDVETLIDSVRLGRIHMPYGLPTPSPEPDFDRPLSNHSAWTEDHKYGVSMFLHLTILDINEVATNMTFWKQVVPAYSEIWTCVRDIVSAIACANQAIQTRDNELILVALRLHLQAIAALRRDLTSLPLSAQVACCLLFDAFNVLRCDFVQAGTQIATARQLTHAVQLETYLEDEKLATVCDALNRMGQSSAWSLWNPSYFLRYEGLRHAEPNLYIELQPIDNNQGVLPGLVQSMERLSRHFAGRIRRNLSESASISRTSQLALDVLAEFKKWRTQFESYIRQPANHRSEDRATIQQAELAWNFTCITFSGGVLSSDPAIYDDPIYTPYYTKINDLAEQRFTEASTHPRNANIKAFLQIIVPSLWLMILMCRDPQVRNRAIQILKSQHYQEGEFNSYIAGQIAEMVVALETRGRTKITAAHQIPIKDRVQIEGIKYLSDTQEIVLSYSSLVEPRSSVQTVTQTSTHRASSSAPVFEKRVKYPLKGDLLKLSNAVLALSQSCTLYRKVRPSAAPGGWIKPMYYRDKLVEVCLDVS